MKTPARRKPPPLTGTQLQRTVMQRAKVLHLRCVHFRLALTEDDEWRTAVEGDGKGWPALVIVGPGGVLYRQIEPADEALTADQVLWIAALQAARADVAVWRPADLASNRIERELKALRVPLTRAPIARRW